MGEIIDILNFYDARKSFQKKERKKKDDSSEVISVFYWKTECPPVNVIKVICRLPLEKLFSILKRDLFMN